MIVDHRAYELQPGQSRELLALSEREGRQVQSKHLGNLVGFFTSGIGNVNEIVHIWSGTKIAQIAPGVAPRWRPILRGRPICRRAENI